MDEEHVYEYIEEANRKQTAELLDAVVNRFRELYADQELILLTLPKNDLVERSRLLAQMITMLKGQA